MNKTKVLLLDTAFASLPIYEYLEKEFEIWVMGNRENDALALLSKDRWIKQDYSQVDAVQSYIDKLDITYVVPGCTDVSIETCLSLNLKYNLFDSVRAYQKLANKDFFRVLCEELSLPSPKRFALESFPQSGMYICKPVDGFSGRGVEIVNGEDLKTIKSSYKKAQKESPSSTAIIEEFVNGQLYSYSAFIEKSKVSKSFCVLEGSSVNRYAVDTSYVENNLPPSILNILQESTEKMASHLHLKDGLVHIQFIKEDNRIYLIEVSRRHPGDLYGLLIEYSTGYQYSAKYASYFVNRCKDTKEKKKKNIIRHTLASSKKGCFKAIQYLHPLTISAFFPLLPLGSKIEQAQKTRIGILFSQSHNKEMLLKDYTAYLQRKVYNYNLISEKGKDE